MKLFSFLLVTLSLASAIVIPSDVGFAKRSLDTFRFKNYQIVKQVGSGASSEVYLAQKLWETPKSSVALKTFPFSELQAAGEEVEILQRISPHPNIIQLIGTTSSKLHFAIILEYIPGGNLLDLVCNHHGMLIANDFRFVQLIFKQILKAVLHIHKKGIVHRDLKPANILVCFDPDNPPTNDDAVLVKLTDFGISHDVNLSPLPTSGTPTYVSPEIITNNLSDVDPRKIDVWALGVILFNLIEKRAPFYGASEKEILYKMNTGVYSFETSVPEAAKMLVSKMLTWNWKDRAGVQEIIEDDWLLPVVLPKHKKAPRTKPSGVTSRLIDTTTALKNTVLANDVAGPTTRAPVSTSTSPITEPSSKPFGDPVKVESDIEPSEVKIDKVEPTASRTSNVPTETYIPDVVIDIADSSTSQVKIDKVEPTATQTSNAPAETYIQHVVFDIADDSTSKDSEFEQPQNFAATGSETSIVDDPAVQTPTKKILNGPPDKSLRVSYADPMSYRPETAHENHLEQSKESDKGFIDKFGEESNDSDKARDEYTSSEVSDETGDHSDSDIEDEELNHVVQQLEQPNRKHEPPVVEETQVSVGESSSKPTEVATTTTTTTEIPSPSSSFNCNSCSKSIDIATITTEIPSPSFSIKCNGNSCSKPTGIATIISEIPPSSSASVKCTGKTCAKPGVSSSVISSPIDKCSGKACSPKPSPNPIQKVNCNGKSCAKPKPINDEVSYAPKEEPELYSPRGRPSSKVPQSQSSPKKSSSYTPRRPNYNDQEVTYGNPSDYNDGEEKDVESDGKVQEVKSLTTAVLLAPSASIVTSADSAKETAVEIDSDKAGLDNSAGKMVLDIWLGLFVVLISLFN